MALQYHGLFSSLLALLAIADAEPTYGASATANRSSFRGFARKLIEDIREDPERAILCTKAGADAWQTGAYVECCADAFECLTEGTWNYVCVTSCDGCQKCAEPATPSPPTPAPQPTLAPPPTPPMNMKALVWNVHWENRNVRAMAEVLIPNDADIIGINEFTGDYTALVHELNSLTSTRSYALQPGSGSAIGYGTDIIFDSRLWDVVEGGKAKVRCPGTQNGDRAANWVVLQERATCKKLVTGGIHLSYCPGSCDQTHECEMGLLYDKLEEMKTKHTAPVLWMGDLNRCIYDRVIQNVLGGRIGSRSVFTTEDVAKVQGRTFYTGGCAIDHILAEGSSFHHLEGGTTGQQIDGQMIAGSDHYPVYTSLSFAR